MKKHLALALVLFSTVSSWAALKTKDVEYHDGDTVLRGYLAYDGGSLRARPGIVLVHEWKGLGDYAKERARQLGMQGYVVFAIDMYGKGVYAKDHEEAARLSGVYFKDRDLMRRRALAGLETLKKTPLVDPARMAAIGYCFGGTTVLELARAGTDLRGVASFHGNLATPSPAAQGGVKAKVLVLHGAGDAWTAGDIPAFQKEMTEADVDWQLISYGGAVHSFTVPTAGNNPSTGMAYNAAADKRSHRALLDFLREIFRP
ncbi:MAG: dienelactone hydrolase family protein [Elusimicrobia bacterium]|nr:dienelactone hydrolase family protein [Elusimicrobiota bacterium]MBK7545243.1 dienelactone hydrolase family protein [Elusimicrobiota bacterium]MBK7688662.1 dienelactone hydrolase family protein [Elusimicrobiota bacterium]MBK8126909.1 dienelactone hydrolase family protein [Elusimicrobiota bacterium]MBK8423726.1 dienelactone hydrolase family protein [Elusimicrobiota bacterium]